jgi:hypothetical protein
VFPARIDSVRADYMNPLDLSLDPINALNRVQWDRQKTDPTSSNFASWRSK